MLWLVLVLGCFELSTVPSAAAVDTGPIPPDTGLPSE